jgi:hypothetical protein
MTHVRCALVWLIASTSACSTQQPARTHETSLDAESGAALDDAYARSDAAALADAEASAPGPLPVAPGVIGIGEPSPNPGPCEWSPLSCEGRSQQVDIAGETPYGPIHIRSVGVSYWIGLTYETRFSLEGTLGGLPMLFEARIADAAEDGELRPQISPGRYVNGDAWTDLFTRVLTCQNDIVFSRSELHVARHEGPTLSDAGLPIRIAGEFIVSDPGWALRIPFDVRELCSLPPP